jgi:stage II sporulation protein GA (sporulation sigma-E factor processing peptidase)
MTIYLDVIWFLNFAIDLLLIKLTAIVLKRNISHMRLIISSFIGSIYVVFIFIDSASPLFTPIMKFLFSNIIMLIAFGYKRFTYHIQGLFMFYFVTFITGGGLLGVHYFLKSEVEIVNGMVATTSTGYGDPVTWLFILIGFPLLFYFTKKRFDQVEVKKLDFTQIVPVQITIDNIIIEANGLIDNGNGLYDPITKVPVMILDMTVFQNRFPDAFIKETQDITSLGNTSDHEISSLIHRLRIIPYRAVGNQGSFMAALKPDTVKFIYDGHEYKTSKLLIGLSFTNLSSEGDYTCIIHPKMIVKGNESLTAS